MNTFMAITEQGSAPAIRQGGQDSSHAPCMCLLLVGRTVPAARHGRKHRRGEAANRVGFAGGDLVPRRTRWLSATACDLSRQRLVAEPLEPGPVIPILEAFWVCEFPHLHDPLRMLEQLAQLPILSTRYLARITFLFLRLMASSCRRSVFR